MNRNKLAELLLIPRLRFYFCKARWLLFRKRLRFYDNPSERVGDDVVKYNLTAFNSDAAFGCGGRMDLLLFPLRALVAQPAEAKVLIVGPRTEDDIFLAKALGLTNTKGIDLFSYSPYIELGDMHTLPYAQAEFDAVVLGWVLAYSSDPMRALEECKRVLKPNGFIAVGWEWVPDIGKHASQHIRFNTVNEADDIRSMVEYPIVFLNDPTIDTNHHKSLIFRKSQPCQ